MNEVNATCCLLAHNFILQLVTESLNDCDVIARLLTLNKSMKNVIRKYSMKRICDTELALFIINMKSAIQLSVPRVKANHKKVNEYDNLLKIAATNELKEVHYLYDLLYVFDQLYGPRGESRPLPHFVTHLRVIALDITIDESVPLIIPDTVIDLDLEGQIPLTKIVHIPQSVKVLKMSVDTHHLTNKQFIPDSVTNSSMSISQSGTSEPLISGMLPSSLKDVMLNLKDPFDARVLPSSLTTLTLGHELLCKLEPGTIPLSVKSVVILSNRVGDDGLPIEEYDMPKPGVLHDSITQLGLYSSDQLDAKLLPPRLKRLDMSFDGSVTAGWIPKTVTHLMTSTNIDGRLPHSITHLKLIGNLKLIDGLIPNSVTHLELTPNSAPRECAPVLTAGMIPSSVTHLVLACFFKLKMVPGIIPASVTHLTFNDSFNIVLHDHAIPSSVTHLVFGEKFNQPISSQMLPPNLTHLCFGKNFNKPIHINHIPASVTSLLFGEKFNQIIEPKVLPQSVKYLAFGSAFSHNLDETCLPRSLDYIEIPRGYLKKDNKLWLPCKYI